MERYFEYGYYHQLFMVGEYVGIENCGIFYKKFLFFSDDFDDFREVSNI